MSIHAQGLRAWIWQRLTALYIAVYLIVGLVWWLYTDVSGYEQWRALIAHPVVNISIVLLFASILLHVGVGVRDIVVDYVHPVMLRFIILVSLTVFIITMGIWMMMVLLSVVSL